MLVSNNRLHENKNHILINSKMISRKFLAILLVSAILAGGTWAWKQYYRQPVAPEAFASGNGRIEATEVNIATKQAGRIEAILVNEGDEVHARQILARMDTATLIADLRQAEAQARQARHGTRAAAAVVTQRSNEQSAANAVVAQRESQQSLAEKDVARTRQLIDKGFVSPQKLDLDKTTSQSSQAATSVAKAQLAETQSAIEAARAGVMQAQSASEAADAPIERIKADIRDTELVAPIDGRVLYRLAEPGEVLGAGGNLLTLLNITDVYMTIFLPAAQAGRVSLGAEARIVLDVRPDISIPATVSFVSPEAQFTPKSVETRSEREKLMFRIKVRIPEELLRAYAKRVKTGLPGVAYVRLDPQAPWPKNIPPLVNAQNAR
jgi:HlyD family secretion protein